MALLIKGGEADETFLGLSGNDGIAGREGADLIEGGELACDFNCVAYDSAANDSAFKNRAKARIGA